uniref:Uncharacterized protein n=1 Tax=Aegilops tauschii subsp. strangulata TaxID=200361 RepID=A0A453FSF2_AEGTS
MCLSIHLQGGRTPRAELQSSRAAGRKKKKAHIYASLRCEHSSLESKICLSLHHVKCGLQVSPYFYVAMCLFCSSAYCVSCYLLQVSLFFFYSQSSRPLLACALINAIC